MMMTTPPPHDYTFEDCEAMLRWGAAIRDRLDHDGAVYLETSSDAREPAAPADGPSSEPTPRLCFDPLGALRHAPRFEWRSPAETKAEIEAEFNSREPAAPAGPDCFDRLAALRYAPRFEWGTPAETKAEIEAEFAAALARLDARCIESPS
jgi:hypothetical protein